jgi:cobalamin biosynthesis protein CobW
VEGLKQDSPGAASAVERCSVMVVSGFLGAGKTTVVRRLLDDAQRTGVRVAVISNEFGALGIDQALLGETGDAYVEIEGGCVCCRLSDELVAQLQMLWERVRPERIIVETSGVALPFDTQLNFWREPVSEWISDDVVVVVVNAEQVAEGRDLEGTFEQQVSSADLLLLNQIDRVAKASLSGVEATLRAIEPDAPLVRAIQGDVDPTLLFPPDPGDERARRRDAPITPSTHDHEQFSTEEIEVEPGVDPDALIARLHSLSSLRCKGFVTTSQGPRLIQGVGTRIDLDPIDHPPQHLLGRVILIRRTR